MDPRLERLIVEAFGTDARQAIWTLHEIARRHGVHVDTIAMRCLCKGQDSIDAFRASLPRRNETLN